MYKVLINISFIFSLVCYSQPHGKLLINNYNQLEIGTESGIFWSVVKDKRGVLYFGGEGEVIEFDGISWRGISIPNRSAVRSLAMDTAGTIYVGAVGEFGFLMSNELGEMEYNSLISKIPKNKLMFPDIWGINIIHNKVYFQADNRLFCYKNGEITTWELNNSYHRSFAIDNHIILNQRDIGLCTLINDTLRTLPEGDFFKHMVISSIFKLENNKLLIGSRTKGLFVYTKYEEGKAVIEPYNNPVNTFLIKNHIYHGVAMPDKRMVFATLHAGVIIVNKNGEINNYINKSTGFIDYTAFYVNVFDGHELWIASSKGLSFHNINSPINYWNDELGIKGFVNCITKHENKIYVGTNSGLFKLDMKNSNNNENGFGATFFNLVNNFNSEVWDIIKFKSSDKNQVNQKTEVLAATGEGMYNITKDKLVFHKPVIGMVSLHQSKKNQSIVYYNTHPTFYILQYFKGNWHILWQKNISSYILSIEEDSKGNVWIGTKFYGIFKIHMSDFYNTKHDEHNYIKSGEISDLRIEHYNTLSGLPNLNLCITFLYKDHLVVSCDGLFTYNEMDNRFVRTDLFGEDVKKWDRTLNAFKEDAYGNIWGIDTEVLDKQADGTFKITHLPYQILTIKNSTLDYYHDKNGETWIGGEQGVFRYDSKKIVPNQKTGFHTLIRKVSLNNDSIIFYGTNYTSHNNLKLTSRTQSTALIPEFSVKNKAIAFEFACPYFQDDIPLEYSYFLEGYEEDWSEWSQSQKKEYNNLREKTYIFHVKARNNAGIISNEGSYQFIITPPIYRTIVAYLLYMIIILIIFYAIIKINSYRLRHYNIVLEKTVNERTLLLEKQKEEINDQAMRLIEQNEKLVHQKNRMSELSKELAESNKNKLQFFTNISHELRTPLTLILGPVNELINQKDETSGNNKLNLYNMIKKNAERLLKLVNQILDFRKIEMQTPKLLATESDLVLYVEDITSYFKDISVKKEIELAFIAEQKEIKTWFDPDKMEKIIFNLLSNAFKYTPNRGKIHIRVGISENHSIENYIGRVVEISVKDNGVGIEEEEIPKIFDRYYQSGKSISFDQAGSGIGLSMAAKLTQIHHGRIELKSKLGSGSTFTVQIPYGKDYLKDDEIKTDKKELFEENESQKTDKSEFKFINTITEKEIVNHKPDVDKDLILLVEDSEDIRSFIKNSLGKKFSFIEAENGLMGLELAQKYLPDIIISDIMMPKMDGYEFCSAIKSNIETSHIPVILLTSKSGALSQKMGLEKGADDYISKPFDIDLLELRISNLITSRAKLQKRYSKEIVVRPSDIVINSTDERFLTKAIKTIEDNMAEPNYDIETFSRDMAMSQSTLYRKLKALTGESTNNFIKDLRLKRGASLLSQNEISVSEIANMIGFDDPAYFSKSFKQKFGVSPTDYSKKFL